MAGKRTKKVNSGENMAEVTEQEVTQMGCGIPAVGAATDMPQLRLENQLCFPLYAAARKVTAAYTPYLKPLGLTYTQYITLMVLWAQDGLRIGELGQRLNLDSGTLTPLLKKMEQAGLIERLRSPADERAVVLRLTEAGKALKEKAAEIPGKVGGCISLEPEEAMELYRILYKILEMEF